MEGYRLRRRVVRLCRWSPQTGEFTSAYDFFLPDTIGLYQTLRRAGHEPSLLIGPWAHSSRQMLQFDMREALAWFRAHLLSDRSGLRSLPVRCDPLQHFRFCCLV